MSQYAPRKRDEIKKVYNTIFVKDLPESHDSEEGVRELFGPFGNIHSIFPNRSEKGNTYFICYGSADTEDREYGPRCAEKALLEMNGKILHDTDKPIYVNAAMNKEQRIKAIKHEDAKFKASKKRCNLFVKNFPLYLTEQDLRDIFSPFGTIESLRLI